LLDAESLITDKHELKFNYKSKQKEFQLDPKLMRFVFNNLLSNAIKYSPQGGDVTLQISSDKKYLSIEVSDEGIGIQPEDLHKIFDAFYRTKHTDHISGTGLGLAILKRSVELHNGEITVESVIGKGTTFKVNIPFVPAT
jgi:signal transduction histidine kinase